MRLVLLAGSGLCSGALPLHAQFSIEPVRGVPFDATLTRTIDRADQKSTAKGKVARNSDGSSYQEIADPGTGEIFLIMITDIPHQQQISLDVRRKIYYIQPSNISPADVINPATPEQLRKAAEPYKPGTPKRYTNGETVTEETMLGSRTADGFVEYGRRDQLLQLPASSKLTERLWEEWRIDSLYVTAEKVGYGDDNKPAMTIKLSDIKTSEPDAKLFEIPAGYTPAPPPTQRTVRP
jgi:hypothetical protein